LTAIDERLMAWRRHDQTSQRLATIPEIGPIAGVSFVLKVAESVSLVSALAARVGITPHEASTDGRQRLGKINREGDEDLRRLLVFGVTAVIRAAKVDRSSPWLLAVLARKPKKLAAVALAKKMARTIWAMMVCGETFRQPAQA
jgi:transposase